MHGVQGQLTGIFKTKSLKEIDVHFQCNQPDFGLKRFTIYLFGQQLLDMKKSKLQHGEAISTAEKYKLRKKSEVVVKKKESNDSTFLDNESGAGELVYSDFVQATKIIPKETERTRTWEAWNAEAVRMFFEALKLHGKNHEAISRYVAEKTKSNPKNYVQVRNFYYNTWGRISGFLNLSHNAPKEAKELFALINFGAWIQKTGSLKIDTNTAELFNELIITGECKMRMEVWKKKSKTFRQFRVQTPECPALRKYLPKDISQSNFIMHDNIVLQLMPHDAWDEYFVIDCGQNPRLKLCVSSKLPIARVFSELEKRWTSSLAFMNGILMPFWFIRLVPDGFKFLRCNAVNNNFNSMKKRAIKRTFSLEFCFPLAEQGECSPFSCSLDADNINEGLTWENSKCISVGQLSVLSGNLQTLRFRYHFCRDSMIDEDRWMDIFACYIRMKLYEEKLKQRMNSMTVATLLREMFLFKSSIEATPLSDDEGDAHNLLSEQQSNSATGAKGTSSKGIASAHNNKKLRRRKRTKKRKKSFQTVITSKLSLIKQHSQTALNSMAHCDIISGYPSISAGNVLESGPQNFASIAGLDPISLNGEEMRNQISEEIDADVNMNDNLEAPEAASISSESSVSSGEATTSTEQQSEALPVAFGRLLRLVFGQFELLSTRMTRGLVFNVTSNCSGIMIFLFVALMMLGSNSTDESEAPNTRQRHALAAMSQHATVASTSTAATASVTTEGKETEKRLYTQWSKEAWQLFFEGLKLHGKDFESIRLYIAGKLKHEAKTYDQVRYFFYNTMSPTATKEAKELFTLINYYEWFRITQCKVDHTSKEIFTKLVLTGVVELKVNMGRKLGKSKVKIRTPACAALDKFVAANRHLMEVREIVTIQFVPHSHKDDGYVNFHCHQRSHLSLRINSKLPVVSVFRYLQKKWLLDRQDCEQASKRRIILIPDGFFFHNLPTGPKVETKIKKKRKYSLMGCFPSSDSTEPEFGDDGNQELSIYNDGISCEICPSILICHLFEMAGQKETIRLRYKFEENHPEQFYIKGNSAFSFFAGDTLALNRPSLFSKKYIEVAEDVRKLLPGRLTESTSLPSTSCATTSKKLISFRKKSDLSKKVPHTSKAAQAPTQSQRVVVDCEAQIGSSNFRHMPYMAPKVTTASEEASVREKSVASTISYTHYCQQVEVIQPQQKQQQEQEHQQRHAMDSSFSGNDLTSAMFSNELLALETNTPLHAFPSTSLQFADHMDQNTLVLSKETPISVDITETKDTSDVNQSLVQNDDIPKLLMQRQKAHLDGFCDWSLDSSSNLDFGPIDFKETLHDDDTRKI
ncbi:Protein cramped-like [Trichinella pseudospiralis]|uniref:Protein cramped-like n=1 Tax=Trichinella pseudospiralis TaxID=6337 RepID=A0A0V1JAE9_TRIPS|nr:Protein cramped-like [Trichinella pseudospiralis]